MSTSNLSSPIDAVIHLVNNTLQIPLQHQHQDVGACHFLPTPGYVKPIFVRFLYDHQRENVWQARGKLKTSRKQNERAIVVVERLTDTDRNVLCYAKSKNCLISTRKGQVFGKLNANEEKWSPFKSTYCVDNFISQCNCAPLFQGADEKVNKHWLPKQAMKRKVETERSYPDSPSNKEKFNDLIALMKEFISSNTTSGYTTPKKAAHTSLGEYNNTAVVSMESDGVTGELHSYTTFKLLKANSVVV